VVRRAKGILDRLEETDRGAARAALVADLPLFAAAPSPPVAAAPSPPAAAAPSPPAAVSRADEMLDGIDPDALSPREALDALYALKSAREAERGGDG
jgi:DNA mismatch repair protein MutS